MIVQPNFLDHPKTRQLVVELGGDELAPLYVLRLWGHCQNQKKHRFPQMSAPMLCAICCAKCAPQQLWLALQNAGFIRFKGDTLIVHEWDKYNQSLITSWRNGKKGGRKRKAKQETRGLPAGNPPVTRGGSDREDKIEKIVCVEKATHTHDSRLASNHTEEIAALFPRHDVTACLRRAERHVRKQRGPDAEVTLGWFVTHWMPREPEARQRAQQAAQPHEPEPELTPEQIAEREAAFRARWVDVPEPEKGTLAHDIWTEARRPAA